MIHKNHQIYIRNILVFFLLLCCGFGQGLFATSGNDVGTTASNTGRYLRPEIKSQQSHLSVSNQSPEVLMYIPNENILTILQSSDSYKEAHDRVRRAFLQELVANGFSGFISTPFGQGNDKMVLLTNTGFADFILLEDIDQKDPLDNLILNKLIQYKNKISHGISTHGLEISQYEYDSLSGIYLFKNNEDLYKLGYELVSYRYRTNNDAAYRRHNISLAFSRIGNIRIINPNETFSFENAILGSSMGNFKVGTAIVGGQVVHMYAGGLCGASTALYQGILTNTALHITQRSPHSKRYATLYDSFVNGQSINIPGLDSTVFFADNKDIQITNTRDYPLIVILNYDGSIGGVEEVFSLAKGDDKGSLAYKGNTKKCYVWEINGADVSSCYQNIF